MKTSLDIQRIIISRTDSIGDVILTLPMCAWLKSQFPNCTVIFLGKSYTKPVVDCYSAVDEFVDWQEIENLPSAEKVERIAALNADAVVHVFPVKEIASLSKKAKIPMRIGTSHRGFHLLTCNHRVNFTRKRSDLHEAQLNFELLRPFGLTEIPSLELVKEYGRLFKPVSVDLPHEVNKILNGTSKCVILHPKSQGSALEWPLERYMELAIGLANEGTTVFFTGTQQEGEQFRAIIPVHERIVDLSGKLTLSELIVLISKVNALVACSTGPLHIAGVCGTHAVGLYSPRKPIHPGRWQPIGKDVQVLVKDADCPMCKKGKKCLCVQQISVEQVFNTLTYPVK
ncbi:MAG: glycosyltransferase family 9 protein [Flavobacteriia bacterium]